MYSGSVYRGRVQSTTLTPTCTPPPPFLLLEVAPSILQNAVRLASRLLQLLHFTSWLVGLSTSSHAPFFFLPSGSAISPLALSLSLSLLPLLWRARRMQPPVCGQSQSSSRRHGVALQDFGPGYLGVL